MLPSSACVPLPLTNSSQTTDQLISVISSENCWSTGRLIRNTDLELHLQLQLSCWFVSQQTNVWSWSCQLVNKILDPLISSVICWNAYLSQLNCQIYMCYVYKQIRFLIFQIYKDWMYSFLCWNTSLSPLLFHRVCPVLKYWTILVVSVHITVLQSPLKNLFIEYWQLHLF